MNEEEMSGLDKLNASLYSRNSQVLSRRRRQRLSEQESNVPSEWSHDSAKEPGTLATGNRAATEEKKLSFMKTFIITATIFFLFAMGLSAYLFIGGTGTLSSGNIDIAILGPISTDAGEEVPLQITITNNNTTALEFTDLLIEYPEGTRSAVDVTTEFLRHRESLGTIAPRESVQRIIRSVLFGQEGSVKDIKVTLEYRVAESNAIFFTEETYTLAIKSAPVTLSFESPKEVSSRRVFNVAVTVTSNASTIIEDALLVADYPPGFAFTGAMVEPTFDNNIWNLGDLAPGSKRTITITGAIEAQDGEDRVFHFTIGLQSKKNEKTVSTPFLTALREVLVTKQFLGVALALDGSAALVHPTESGERVRADITWINNLPVPVTDVEIRAVLTGPALDQSSVSAVDGFYNSNDNVVVWDSQTNPPLASILPGERGQVAFSFKSFALGSPILSSLTDPTIDITLNVTGRRTGEEGVLELVNAEVTKTVQVISDLLLTSRLTYFSGPIINNGPLPPEVGKETTYTVIWSIMNTTSGVVDGTVRAKLPTYVRWLGAVSPGSENVSFNSVGGEVVWSVGNIKAGTGVVTSPREVAFQVAFVPSISQVGDSPIIVDKTSLEGRDSFSGVRLTDSERGLSTNLTTDPAVTGEQGRVIQ